MVVISRNNCLMLKVLLSQYDRQKQSGGALTRYLPAEVVEQMRLESVDCDEAAQLFVDVGAVMSQFHYSWIYDAILKFPTDVHPFLAASLPENHLKAVAQLLKLPVADLQKRSVIAGDYFLRKIYQEIDGAVEVLPVGLLPHQPLSGLLEINRTFLLETIDLLGIFDLAAKVRQTVNTVELRKITDCLSPLKQKFLKIVISKVDKFPMPPIDLSSWDGSAAKLQKIIHRRGLYRLSLVMSAYSSDFVWHLTHRLDTGRADIIYRYYIQKENANISHLSDQVLFIMNTLTQKSVL